MSLYLYHPKYLSRARQTARVTEPIHERLYTEQITMDCDEWSRLYNKVSRMEAEAERGCFMQWTTLLARVIGVRYTEEDCYKFSFREMRQIRNLLRKLLVRSYDSYCALLESSGTPAGVPWNNLTYQSYLTTLRWAEDIFANGLKDSVQVYLA